MGWMRGKGRGGEERSETRRRIRMRYLTSYREEDSSLIQLPKLELCHASRVGDRIRVFVLFDTN